MQRTAETLVDRATGDRRQFGWRTVLYGFLRSRRRDRRRQLDGESLFSDWHHPWLFFLAIFTMIFSSLDAFMTLLLIDQGATEINPFMAALIGHDVQRFAAVKMLLTAVGVLALVFLSRARFLNRFRNGLFLTVVFSLYACLVCYEFVQLMQLD